MNVAAASCVADRARELLDALERMHGRGRLSLRVQHAEEQLRIALALQAAAEAERERIAA